MELASMAPPVQRRELASVCSFPPLDFSSPILCYPYNPLPGIKFTRLPPLQL